MRSVGALAKKLGRDTLAVSQSGGGGAGDEGQGGEDADIFSEDVDLNVVSPEKLEVREKSETERDVRVTRGWMGEEWGDFGVFCFLNGLGNGWEKCCEKKKVREEAMGEVMTGVGARQGERTTLLFQSVSL